MGNQRSRQLVLGKAGQSNSMGPSSLLWPSQQWRDTCLVEQYSSQLGCVGLLGQCLGDSVYLIAFLHSLLHNLATFILVT